MAESKSSLAEKRTTGFINLKKHTPLNGQTTLSTTLNGKLKKNEILFHPQTPNRHDVEFLVLFRSRKKWRQALRFWNSIDFQVDLIRSKDSIGGPFKSNGTTSAETSV